ncbi:MAG TPA: hypothetical protein VH763_00045 [Gemmatimonadales bacterium]|jgi:hypothetical protein
MSDHGKNGIELPAPTAGPVVVAGGVTLLGAGYLMHPMFAIAGVLAVLLGCIGWFHDVLPVERTEVVPALEQPPTPPQRGVPVPPVGADAHRMRLPLEVYPYSAGLKAGLAGGAAMAIVGCTFGLLTHGSLWYPVNLLAAAGSAALTRADTAELLRFSARGLVLASVAHLSLSILVGILYAALLPIFSRRPMLTASVFIPLLMSGITWALLRAVNPLLDQRIEWIWFIAAQVAFGVFAGWVVSRTEPIATAQTLPLGLRAGLETTGTYRETQDGDA